MLRISLTTLDRFRYWRDTDFEDEAWEHRVKQELLATIRGQKVPKSEPALRGIAFANVLEEPTKHMDSTDHGIVYRCDGFEFDANSVAEFMLHVPNGALREVWMPRFYLDDMYLVARADFMHAVTVYDAKLITKAFNKKKYIEYEESVQWKGELLMADADHFVYLVARGKERRDNDVIEIQDVQKLDFYRSEATDEQVRQLMRDYRQFYNHHIEEAA